MHAQKTCTGYKQEIIALTLSDELIEKSAIECTLTDANLTDKFVYLEGDLLAKSPEVHSAANPLALRVTSSNLRNKCWIPNDVSEFSQNAGSFAHLGGDFVFGHRLLLRGPQPKVRCSRARQLRARTTDVRSGDADVTLLASSQPLRTRFLAELV